MEFATGLTLSWNTEKSPRFPSDHWRIENMRSLISMEIISRPVSSMSMCTARSTATRWKHQWKRFAAFAISTRVAARHRFCSLPLRRLSTQSSRSWKRFAIVGRQSARLPVFISKGRSFQKRKPEHNAANSFNTPHRLPCGSCLNTQTS
jgi:hypothetical protein